MSQPRAFSDLDAFIKESIRVSMANGYYPSTFIAMRERWGTREAIRRLVIQSDIQSGFRKLRDLSLLDWTIEAAVLKFPSDFDRATRDAAQFRLGQAGRAS